MGLQAQAATERPDARKRICLWVAASLVILPAVCFGWILLRFAINLPYADDYGLPLNFLVHLTSLHGARARVEYFFSVQHNEYRLFFEEGVFWLQFIVAGRVNFRALCLMGDSFIFLMAFLLWKMFLPGCRNLTLRLALFAPASYLIFQLQYVETLNWAMGSLQNLPILFFSFTCIYLLVRNDRISLFAAVICFFFAVASSGNGLLLVLIGALILAIDRRFKRFAIWLMSSAVCLAVYFHHYRFSVLAGQNHSVFRRLL